MKKIYIFFCHSQKNLLEHTLKHFYEFADKESRIDIYSYSDGRMALGVEGASDMALLCVSAAHSIIKLYEPYMIKRELIKKEPLELLTKEKRMDSFDKLSHNDSLAMGILKQKRKLAIASELQEYLNSHQYVYIDGMIHFRLRAYKAHLKSFVLSLLQQSLH